jgi:hypothetical protein
VRGKCDRQNDGVFSQTQQLVYLASTQQHVSNRRAVVTSARMKINKQFRIEIEIPMFYIDIRYI